MTNRYAPFYNNVAKQGINNSIGLRHYLTEAVYYKQHHELISAISSTDWLYFNNVDPQTNGTAQYVATLTQDLKGFNLAKRYEHSIRQIAVIPTTAVFDKATIKKFHLGGLKPTKSTTTKSKPKPKSDTTKAHNSTRTKRAKKSSRTRKGRKSTKSPKRRAKK